MKKLIYGAFFLAFIGILVVGCEKDVENSDKAQIEINKLKIDNSKTTWSFSAIEYDNKIEASFEDSNYEFHFTAEITDEDIIDTYFNITNTESTNSILNVEFSENTNQEFYKLYTRNDLLSIANNILKTSLISNEDFTYIVTSMDLFLEHLIDYSNGSFFQKQEYLAFHFPLSIVKMVKRAVQENHDECSCNTTSLYFEENAGFSCSQDMIYQVELVESYLYNLDTVVYKDSSFSVDPALLDSISNISINYINYYELTQLIANLPHGSVVQDSTSGALFSLCGLFGAQGSSIGCCGNYSGPCWGGCSMACLAHDLECWCCNSNYVPCLSGCVPESDC
ncbi:MAG: hypothetical protein RIC95_06145 [Vicingaceae bacterium]